jgi:tetratricopeptide (TPR) repeat protein
MAARLVRTTGSVVLCAALLIAAGPAGSAGGGGGGVPSADSASRDSQQRIAAGHYRAGLRARDAAWRFEARAKQQEDREEAKRLYAKARREFEKAITSQRKAIKAAPELYQAHGSLGYALRRIGRYDEAIASYDRALEIEPRYGEAVEYRAEAYLELGRLDDVRLAWAQLQGVPELSAQLREAMEHWVEKRRRKPGTIEPERIEAFAAWLAEQTRAGGPPTAPTDAGRW